MTQTQIKPWSQVDDDVVTGDAPSAERDAPRPELTPSTPYRAAMGKPAGVRAYIAQLRAIHAIVPLAIAACWLLSGMAFGFWGGGFSRGAQFGMFTLNGLAIAIVMFSWRARKDRITELRIALDRIGRERADVAPPPSIDDELQQVWSAVEQHATSLSGQLQRIKSDQKQMELALSLSGVQKQQAEAVLRAISDPVLVTDAYDQLVQANPAAEELFGIKGDQSTRMPVSEIISDEKIVAAIRDSREAEVRVAKRRIEIDIGDRVFAMTLSPIGSQTSGGVAGVESHGVVCLMRDITKDRLAARMKSEFVAQVAHELRTPLSSIRAYVEMLVDGEASDEKTRNEYYGIIDASADRLGRLIDNMLNISRIEAGTVRISKEAVSLSIVAKEACDLMRPAAEEKSITLTEELTPTMYQVMADRDLIYQAILNLLSNAVKYTPSGGSVQLRMLPLDVNKLIRIEVTDTGLGIPKEDLPRMFQKFFRVEANKQLAKGTGLGLNLVKQIVETVHGGELTLTSEVGKGSTFGIVLPLAAENAKG